MKVRLTRIESSHSNLRTDTVEGDLLYWPVVGESIIITAEPLVESGMRLVRTSSVCKIEGDLFHTRNSVYRLERLDEVTGN